MKTFAIFSRDEILCTTNENHYLVDFIATAVPHLMQMNADNFVAIVEVENDFSIDTCNFDSFIYNALDDDNICILYDNDIIDEISSRFDDIDDFSDDELSQENQELVHSIIQDLVFSELENLKATFDT